MGRNKQIIRRALWAIFLVSLPVSSFPYFPPSLGGGSASVRPLLVYPLLALVLFFVVPALWKKPLPLFWRPFLLFVILAVISSLLPFLRGAESKLGEVEISSRIIRSLITLALAGAIYWTVSVIPRDRAELAFTLRWLYAGLGLALFWGSLQILYVLEVIPGWYQLMRKWQGFISVSKLFPNRISGMAFEPSWFADQLAALWLPWVFGAVLTDYTVFRWRWRWITVERILFLWLNVVLLFTLSRAGLGVAVLVIIFGILFLRRKPRTAEELSSPNPKKQADGKDFRNFLSRGVIKRVGLAVGVVLALAVLFWLASFQSNYISRMWNYWQRANQRGLQDYFTYIGFGPRFVYWRTAYNMFTQYPLFGVGLGNYTFHFTDYIPAVQIGYMPELIRRFVPGMKRIITSKHFLAHLLAETGLFGTMTFLVFFFTLLVGAFILWLSKDTEKRYWGTASLLGLTAFLIDTFSYDSFAVPNPWIVFGLVTSSIMVLTQGESDEDSVDLN